MYSIHTVWPRPCSSTLQVSASRAVYAPNGTRRTVLGLLSVQFGLGTVD